MRKSGVIVCSQSAAYDTYLVNNLAEFEKRSELSRTRQSIEQHVMGGELGASSSPPRMPLTLVKYESGTNVSEVSTRMRRAKAHALLTGLMCGQHETDDTFLIDLVSIRQQQQCYFEMTTLDRMCVCVCVCVCVCGRAWAIRSTSCASAASTAASA